MFLLLCKVDEISGCFQKWFKFHSDHSHTKGGGCNREILFYQLVVKQLITLFYNTLWIGVKHRTSSMYTHMYSI